MKFLNQEYNIKIWNGENLGDLVAADTETTMADWTDTPDICTMQAYGGGDDVYFVRISDLLLFFNTHHKSDFIYHNAPFDVDVFQKAGVSKRRIYDWYDNEQILDTSILYRLLHLAEVGYVPFKYNLSFLSNKYLGEELDKAGEERVTFAQYLDKPVEDISDAHKEYAAKDAIATYQLWLALKTQVNNLPHGHSLLSHHIQVKGDLALSHTFKNGIGFDLESRDKWLEEKDRLLEVCKLKLSQWGYLEGQKGNVKRFESACDRLNISDKLPRTKDGSISSSEETLEPYRHIEFVDSYLTFQSLKKETSFVRDICSSRVNPRYTSIKVTGRTSCAKPNIQNQPRGGEIRSMFVPEEGKVFVDIDYSSLELAVLAQINLIENGESEMARLINEGKCLHYHTAASVYNKPESEVTKDERQFAKIPNFGFGANMSPDTFVDYCKGYGVEITPERSKKVKDAWLKTYPEMKKFFNVGNQTDSITLSGRVRANSWYTAYLNSKFQGLACDGAKLALYNVDKAGYKIVAFIHDQIMVECDKEDANRALEEVSKIMVDSMQTIIPDVKIGVEGQILERWCK